MAVPEQNLAYLSRSKLHLCGGGATGTIDSAFGRSLRDRGARFIGGAMRGVQPGDPDGLAARARASYRPYSPGLVGRRLEQLLHANQTAR